MHLLALRLTKYSRDALSFNSDGSSSRAHEHLFVLRPVCIEVEHLNDAYVYDFSPHSPAYSDVSLSHSTDYCFSLNSSRSALVYDPDRSLRFAGMHTDRDDLYFPGVSDFANPNVLYFLYKSIYSSSVSPQITSYFSRTTIDAVNLVAAYDLGLDPVSVVFASCVAPDLLEQPLFPRAFNPDIGFSSMHTTALVSILRDALVGFCSNSTVDFPLALQCSFNIIESMLHPINILDFPVLFVPERIYQSVYTWLCDFVQVTDALDFLHTIYIISRIQRIQPQALVTSSIPMDPLVLQAVQDTVRNAFDDTKVLLSSDPSITDSALRDAFISALAAP